jgi:hypothetical protein
VCPVSRYVNWHSHYGKIWKLLKETDIYTISSNPTAKDLQSVCGSNICTPTVTVALFTIAKLWNQPTCPSTLTATGKAIHIRTMEYYSAFKKKEMLSFVTTWVGLENTILMK